MAKIALLGLVTVCLTVLCDARKTMLFQYQQWKHTGSSYVILR